MKKVIKRTWENMTVKEVRQGKSNMRIPGNKSKGTEWILKTNSRKHSENKKGLEGHIIWENCPERQTPRHILVKFLDSKEKGK